MTAHVCEGFPGAPVLRGGSNRPQRSLRRRASMAGLVAGNSGSIDAVKFYDHDPQMQIANIDRPADRPRADLVSYTIHQQDDATVLIAWID
ncbi:hypothetical protein D9619_000173 [Psilocybe cf. subviscida]|uniref:Uncharacterized protein n=1 Tax=Psilocybe cf. subviscida TaxID=2480587 RepID=A0A8H5F3F9_9AGAR|nr:hypothetical protein D9619_000173 [Psilocybe cf. subviscida]